MHTFSLEMSTTSLIQLEASVMLRASKRVENFNEQQTGTSEQLCYFHGMITFKTLLIYYSYKEAFYMFIVIIYLVHCFLLNN